MIRILYFASLREQLGMPGESIDLPADVATIGQLRDYLIAREQKYAPLGSMRNLRAAVNQAMVSFDAPVGSGDEVAFFPPVTGG